MRGRVALLPEATEDVLDFVSEEEGLTPRGDVFTDGEVGGGGGVSDGVGVEARELALEEESPNIPAKKLRTADAILDKKLELSRVLFLVEMLWDPTTPDGPVPASCTSSC